MNKLSDKMFFFWAVTLFLSGGIIGIGIKAWQDERKEKKNRIEFGKLFMARR
jgi:hypothetical protein